MYNYFSFATFTLNTSGGAEIVLDKCTKEVDGKPVPCDEAESILKVYDKMKTVGGNKATKNIKCVLFDQNGDVVKVEEVKKPMEAQVDTKKVNAEKALADYMANPTEENLAKIKEVVETEPTVTE